MKVDYADTEKWKGWEWRLYEIGVLLTLHQGVLISFFKLAPPIDESKLIQSVAETKDKKSRFFFPGILALIIIFSIAILYIY